MSMRSQFFELSSSDESFTPSIEDKGYEENMWVCPGDLGENMCCRTSYQERATCACMRANNKENCEELKKFPCTNRISKALRDRFGGQLPPIKVGGKGPPNIIPALTNCYPQSRSVTGGVAVKEDTQLKDAMDLSREGGTAGLVMTPTRFGDQGIGANPNAGPSFGTAETGRSGASAMDGWEKQTSGGEYVAAPSVTNTGAKLFGAPPPLNPKSK